VYDFAALYRTYVLIKNGVEKRRLVLSAAKPNIDSECWVSQFSIVVPS
jgi:hypothetical protein